MLAARGLIDLLLIALGYCTAVTVAVFVAVWLMVLPVSLFGDSTATGFVADVPAAIAFGIVLTFPSALPGFVFWVLVARRQGWNGWWRFALAGAANVVPAVLIQAMWGGGILPLNMLVPCFPGGFAGGFAYWFLTGRHLARRWQGETVR